MTDKAASHAGSEHEVGTLFEFLPKMTPLEDTNYVSTHRPRNGGVERLH